MRKVLQDIWIMMESGIVVFHRVFDEKVNALLFGAMMSALNMFASELSTGGLTNFDLSEKHFTLTKRENLVFIVNSNRDIKQKRIDQELEVIIEMFFELYGDIIKDWIGDTSIFSNFEQEIEESLETPMDKFEKAFW